MLCAYAHSMSSKSRFYGSVSLPSGLRRLGRTGLSHGGSGETRSLARQRFGRRSSVNQPGDIAFRVGSFNKEHIGLNLAGNAFADWSVAEQSGRCRRGKNFGGSLLGCFSKALIGLGRTDEKLSRNRLRASVEGLMAGSELLSPPRLRGSVVGVNVPFRPGNLLLARGVTNSHRGYFNRVLIGFLMLGFVVSSAGTEHLHRQRLTASDFTDFLRGWFVKARIGYTAGSGGHLLRYLYLGGIAGRLRGLFLFRRFFLRFYLIDFDNLELLGGRLPIAKIFAELPLVGLPHLSRRQSTMLFSALNKNGRSTKKLSLGGICQLLTDENRSYGG